MSDNKVVIERVFDAPVERVWRAWTEADEIKKWWGPKDFTAPHIELDFRVGGRYLYAMHGPAGTVFDTDMWSTGTFKEIIPLRKIVYKDSFADADGTVVPPSTYGLDGMSEVLTVTIEFTALENGQTKVHLTHEGTLGDSEHARNMEAGWNQSLDKFAGRLA